MFGTLYSDESLKGVRVSIVGKLAMPLKELKIKLKNAGAECNDKGEVLTNLVKKTDLLIIGKNPNEDDMKRVSLNKHDGFCPKEISEEKLYSILSGAVVIEVPKIKKNLNLTVDYYNWTPPVIDEKEFVSKVSSPLLYDFENFFNPLAGKEIFVPDFEGINMNAFRQIIGNVGGYANKQYYDDTNIVMLSDKTLENLKQGIKDDAIKIIEQSYNNGNSDEFNVQFTSEKDFLTWIDMRLKKYPDQSTINLLKILKV
mgnify:CR=1 FL=1